MAGERRVPRRWRCSSVRRASVMGWRNWYLGTTGSAPGRVTTSMTHKKSQRYASGYSSTSSTQGAMTPRCFAGTAMSWLAAGVPTCPVVPRKVVPGSVKTQLLCIASRLAHHITLSVVSSAYFEVKLICVAWRWFLDCAHHDYDNEVFMTANIEYEKCT